MISESIEETGEMEEFVRTEMPRFVDMESGEEISPQTGKLAPADLETGEVVHVQLPGSKTLHYRVESFKAAEGEKSEIAYVRLVPTVYRNGLILALLLLGSWFAIRALIKLFF